MLACDSVNRLAATVPLLDISLKSFYLLTTNCDGDEFWSTDTYSYTGCPTKFILSLTVSPLVNFEAFSVIISLK